MTGIRWTQRAYALAGWSMFFGLSIGFWALLWMAA